MQNIIRTGGWGWGKMVNIL